MTVVSSRDADSLSRNVTPVVFIRDQAAETDFFGSHGRVAGAVATAIRDDEGLSVVGLLGPWGSGKSTVVRLVEKELAPTHRVFTYDAWLHQSDPPRRSFLEQFLIFLDTEKLVDLNSWQEALDRINRRIEETTTSTTPHLTTGGRLLLLSLIGVPVGSRFLGVDWAKQTLSKYWTQPEAWVFLLGLLTTFAPLIVAFSIYLYSRFRRNSSQGTESLLDLVISRQVRTQTSRVTKTPEPTTIEFQELFRNLLCETGLAHVRLVIVIDNLDRLPAAEAMEMWSTIRSFFLGAIREAVKPVSLKIPTVLLPIDPRGIARLHVDKDETVEVELLRSFMDKTFDVSFHVSGPVVSDWQEYFLRAMRNAFGKVIVEQWGFEIIRIYAKRKTNRVTPRDLNRQVNAIMAVWLQWRDTSIAFPVIAYYAIFRESLESDLISAITAPAYDLSQYNGWQRAIAAIHFGVPQDNAMQVLMGPEVEEAIEKVDHKKFRSMLAVKGLQQLVADRLDVERPDLKMTSNLAELFHTAQGSVDWEGGIWTLMRRNWLRSEMNQRLTIGIEAGRLFKLLLKNCTPFEREALTEELAVKITEWRRSPINMRGEAPEQALFALLETWLPYAAAINVPPIVTLHDTSAYLHIAPMLMEEFKALELIRSDQDSSGLARVAANSLGQGDPDQRGLVGMMSLTLSLDPSDDAKQQLFAAAVEVIMAEKPHGVRLNAALHVLGLLRRSYSAAAEWLSDFARGGRLKEVLEAVIDHWDHQPTERLLALCVLEETDIPAGPGEGWGDYLLNHPATAQAIDLYVAEYGNHSTERILRLARVNRTWAIAAKLLELRIDAQDLGSLDLGSTISSFDDYSMLMPEGKQVEFLSLLAQREDFWTNLEQRKEDTSTFSIYGRLLLNWPEEDELRSFASRSLQRFLKDRSSAWWESQMQESGPVISLACRLAEANYTLDTRLPALFDALTAGIERLIKSERSTDADAWFAAAQLIDADERRNIIQALGDRVAMLADTVTKLATLRAGGEQFLDIAFDERPDLAVDHLLIPMIASLEGLLWISGHAPRSARWVASASKIARHSLRQRINEPMADLSDSGLKIRMQLLKSWELLDLEVSPK